MQALPDGGVLVADVANRLVLRMDEAGAPLWAYTSSSDSSLRAPVCARRLDDGRYLIVDRDAHRVFIVGINGALRWQYGATGAAGRGVGQLDSPTYAEVRADGNVLIADAGNHRVIVVRASDYAEDAGDLGYTDASVVWQYGMPGSPGTGADQLMRPTSAQWLTSGAAAGNVLICDEGAGRVVEVRAADYAAGAAGHGFSADSLVWQYPAEAGASRPSFALGAFGAGAVVWIADADAGHVYAVATGSGSGRPNGHDVVADFGAGEAGFTGSLVAPVALSLTSDGAVAVADPGVARACVLGTTAANAVTTSTRLTCGRNGRKLFASVTCTYTDVPYAPIGVGVSIDGAEDWMFLTFPTVGGGPDGTGAIKTATLPLPPKSIGTTLRYQIIMAKSDGARAFSPLLASISVAWEPRGPASGGSGGGGEGGDNAGASGSGDYTYPGSSGGSGEGSGGGTGGGSGSGSGSGSGIGYGTGSSGSPTGADAGQSVSGGSTGAEIPEVVDPAAATAAGSEAVVSGYKMRASGFAGGGEGGGSSPSEASAAGGWLLVPATLGLVSIVLLTGAAAAERRRIRAYSEFDPARPRALPAEYMPLARPPLPPPIVKPRGRR